MSHASLSIRLAREEKEVLPADCDQQGSPTDSLGHPQPDSLHVTPSDRIECVLNGILTHAREINTQKICIVAHKHRRQGRPGLSNSDEGGASV